MHAIRQIVEVKDNKINIELPKDFEAEKVEVIIFRADDEDYFISEEEKELMRERVKNTDPQKYKKWRDFKKNYL